MSSVISVENLSKRYIIGHQKQERSYFVGLAISSCATGITVHFYGKSCLSFNVVDPHECVITRPAHAIPIPGLFGRT